MYSVGSNALSLYAGASIQPHNNCWCGEAVMLKIRSFVGVPTGSGNDNWRTDANIPV